MVTDGAPLQVSPEPPPAEPFVSLRLTRDAYAALLAGDATRARVEVEGDHAAAAALRGWIDRVIAG